MMMRSIFLDKESFIMMCYHLFLDLLLLTFLLDSLELYALRNVRRILLEMILIILTIALLSIIIDK